AVSFATRAACRPRAPCVASTRWVEGATALGVIGAEGVTVPADCVVLWVGLGVRWECSPPEGRPPPAVGITSRYWATPELSSGIENWPWEGCFFASAVPGSARARIRIAVRSFIAELIRTSRGNPDRSCEEGCGEPIRLRRESRSDR